ncbi:MAG: protein-glutamate O-methyltransferase CheR [Proteobacteria bacterium]|uniref:CheR family methyltransferase n=1 Tax=Aquabacterium sp. TaxID=1872578 RepID=UPI0035C6D6C7|nr:protein-glutamate O-methyltransferase CheR [Pseudomonadota bacterium]
MQELPLSEQVFAQIRGLMHESIGLDLAPHKRTLVSARLGPRIQRLGLRDFDAYLHRVCSDSGGGEFQMMVDLLTTHETYFFREPRHFDVMEAELSERRPASLRVWSAASSFGDEAYSLAMLLSELAARRVIGREWSVLGTDISERVLRSAIEGVYPADRLRHVSEERLKRHCLQGHGESEGLVAMRPDLKARVSFGQANLCHSVQGVGLFDVVFLRNVLIYFDGPTKTEVVERVLAQLKPGGLFFIGSAEGRVPCAASLVPITPGAFRKA